jgi:predicted ferric reductase
MIPTGGVIMWRGFFLVLLYVAIVVCPVLLVTMYSPQAYGSVLYEIGKSCALMGFMMLALQVVLAGRFKWIERHFGFDILIRYHKHMAVLATILLIAHPLLLALGGGGLRLLTRLKVPWYITAGKVALLILLVNSVISLFRMPDRLRFERWRVLHDILGPALLLAAFAHSRLIGRDMWIPPLRALWALALGAAMVLFIYHRLLRPLRLRRHPYQVVDVRREVSRVWTIELAPPRDEKLFDFVPGQFQFITLLRKGDLPVEEHHWTISSSPTEKGSVSSTIKELGDFTATIGQTKPGDSAVVHGPFGRFSYMLHPEERDLVFVAGGIGITPLMSMLRHMRDTRIAMPVLLLYANRNQEEIAFHQELTEMERGASPSLKVIHLLSKPAQGWTGEKGRLDREKIKRYCGADLKDKSFYLCGPPGMVSATIENLRSLGVSDGRMHVEIFSFVD